jgi:hypothetical protein
MVPYDVSLSSPVGSASFLIVTTRYVSTHYDFDTESDAPRLIASGY